MNFFNCFRETIQVKSQINSVQYKISWNLSEHNRKQCKTKIIKLFAVIIKALSAENKKCFPTS